MIGTGHHSLSSASRKGGSEDREEAKGFEEGEMG